MVAGIAFEKGKAKRGSDFGDAESIGIVVVCLGSVVHSEVHNCVETQNLLLYSTHQ